MQVFAGSLFAGSLGKFKQCTVAAIYFHIFVLDCIIKYLTVDAREA